MRAMSTKKRLTEAELRADLERMLLHRMNDYLFEEGYIPESHYRAMRQKIFQHKSKVERRGIDDKKTGLY